MLLFLGSANSDDIAAWVRQGVIDGVTTNPSVFRRDGLEGGRAPRLPL